MLQKIKSKYLLALPCLVFSGCALPIVEKEGTTHHLIVGLGIVSVNDSVPTSAVVTRSKALGLNITNQPKLKFAAGYSSDNIVTVAEDADNLMIDIAPEPTGNILIKIDTFNLNKNSNE